MLPFALCLLCLAVAPKNGEHQQVNSSDTSDSDSGKSFGELVAEARTLFGEIVAAQKKSEEIVRRLEKKRKRELEIARGEADSASSSQRHMCTGPDQDEDELVAVASQLQEIIQEPALPEQEIEKGEQESLGEDSQMKPSACDPVDQEVTQDTEPKQKVKSEPNEVKSEPDEEQQHPNIAEVGENTAILQCPWTQVLSDIPDTVNEVLSSQTQECAAAGFY